MSLLAYNLTNAPLLLAASHTPVTLPPASNKAAVNVSSELKGLPAIGGFDLLQAQVLAGDVRFEWTGLPEFDVHSLIVGVAQDDIADADKFIWCGAASSEPVPSVPPGVAGAAGTASAPTTLTDALSRVPAGWKGAMQIMMLPGTYDQPSGANTFLASLGAGPLGVDTASPLALVGDFTNEIGDQQLDAADVNGRHVTYGSFAPPATTLSDNPLPTWTAQGLLTVVDYTQISDNDYVTIPDGTNTPVNFEFKKTGGFSPKAPLPRAVVDVSGAGSNDAAATAIVTALNSKNYLIQPNPFNIYGTAVGGGSGQVTLTNERQGTAGNTVITVVVTNAGCITKVDMLGGAATTTININAVPGTAAFPSEGFIQIDSEIIGYTGKTATSFTGCTRAMRDTLVDTHLLNAAVTQIDQYAGYYIALLDGPGGNVTQRRQIGLQSLAGQLNVLQKFSPVPSAGTWFRIEKPAVRINITSNKFWFSNTGGNVGLKGIEFNFSSNAGFSLARSGVYTEGVWMVGVSPGNRGLFFPTGAAGFASSGSLAAPNWANAGANNPFDSTRIAGTYFKNMTLAGGGAAGYSGQMVLHGVSVDLTECAFNVDRIFADRVEMILARGVTSNMQFDTSTNPVICMFTRSRGGNPFMFLEQNAVLRRLTGAAQFDNFALQVIFMRMGSQAREIGSNSPILMTGKNNGGVGLQAIYGSFARIQGSGVNLRGALGEVKAGRAATSITWSQLRAQYPNSQDGAAGNIYQADRPAYLQPVKVAFTGLTAADSFDITSGPLGGQAPALAIAALRVTAGAAAALGSYAVSDTAATALAPAQSIIHTTPYKKTFAGLVAASSFDLTLAPLSSPAAIGVYTLRVTGGAAAPGPRQISDAGDTPSATVATISDDGKTITFEANVTDFIIEYLPVGTQANVGLATISDNGKIITFPAGSNVTAFTLEYIPADPYRYDAAQIVNNSV